MSPPRTMGVFAHQGRDDHRSRAKRRARPDRFCVRSLPPSRDIRTSACVLLHSAHCGAIPVSSVATPARTLSSSMPAGDAPAVRRSVAVSPAGVATIGGPPAVVGARRAPIVAGAAGSGDACATKRPATRTDCAVRSLYFRVALCPDVPVCVAARSDTRGDVPARRSVAVGENIFKDDITRREAMKTALKAGAYAAPVVLAATVPEMVSAAVTPPPTTTSTTAPPTTTTTTTSTTTTRAPSADIEIKKTVDNMSPEISINPTVTFTVTVKNLGPSPATGVMVTDHLPAGDIFLFPSFTVSQGTFNPSTGIFNVGALAVGAVATLTITGDVFFTPVTNTATRTASSPADPNPANDSASVTVVPMGGFIIG